MERFLLTPNIIITEEQVVCARRETKLTEEALAVNIYELLESNPVLTHFFLEQAEQWGKIDFDAGDGFMCGAITGLVFTRSLLRQNGLELPLADPENLPNIEWFRHKAFVDSKDMDKLKRDPVGTMTTVREFEANCPVLFAEGTHIAGRLMRLPAEKIYEHLFPEKLHEQLVGQLAVSNSITIDTRPGERALQLMNGFGTAVMFVADLQEKADFSSSFDHLQE